MNYKVNRIAAFIDKYGFRRGIGLYLGFKFDRLSKVKIPGIKSAVYLRKDSSDIAMFDQVFLYNEYQVDFSFQPHVIIDAGANIGLFSVLMKNRFPESKIICIEPGKENYEILNKNLNTYSNVETVYAGLWNSITKLNVIDKYKIGQSALVVEEDAENDQAPAITIEALMKIYSLDYIDILKIDIEASEKELFLKNYEQWLPKVRIIIIELHDWMKDGCSKTFFEAINKSFRRYSYSVCGENTIIENKELA